MGAPEPRRGRFLVLEGIDGSGKSTQIERLSRWLPGSGLLPAGARVVTTREPGGTPLGRALRELLLHPPVDAAPATTAELLLYAADRAQHVQTLIAPALSAGDWVISDRFTGSTAAYQGHGRRLSLALIEQLEAIATGGLVPDLTLWLDLPLDQSFRRRQDRGADRIEAAGQSFLERVGDGFAQLASQRGWTRLEAGRTIAEVEAAIRAAVRLHCPAPGAEPGHG
jgi:dTMP kinase